MQHLPRKIVLPNTFALKVVTPALVRIEVPPFVSPTKKDDY